jgi:hypothetical protein
MIKSHTLASYAELDALVNSGRVVRSQAIAGLIKGVVSAIRRRFARRGEDLSKTSISVSLYH